MSTSLEGLLGLPIYAPSAHYFYYTGCPGMQAAATPSAPSQRSCSVQPSAVLGNLVLALRFPQAHLT